MNLLLDTHTLMWSLDRPAHLSKTARTAIQDARNGVFVSSVVAWELAIKLHTGKLDVQGLMDDFSSILAEKGFLETEITVQHALRAGALPLHHKDPFDRMLAAQSQEENWPIVSCDRVFDLYSVRRIW